ncbi:MAG: helix-turn-helix domain-containing protein [Acidobacteriia bacterium]|nr:helix-turn-helix domain-containing protein [Terriglobia bacterium]
MKRERKAEKKAPGEMILALRQAMGKETTQEDFAEAFDVTQPVVSSWEKGRATPTPETYMRMGNLAARSAMREYSMWFWEQAGQDIETVESVVEERLKARGLPAMPGEMIELPLLSIDEAERGPQAKLESGQVFRFSAARVVNRASTVALRVDRDAEGIVFAPGDIVVVDRSSTKLQSLWNKVVLVHLDPSVLPASLGVGEWHWGPCMGLLKFSELPWDRFLWGAALGPLGSFKHEPVVIGYKHSQARKQFFQDSVQWKWRRIRREKGLEELPAADDPEPNEEGLYERERERVRENIKPTDGCTVIGRMIAWFSAAAGEAKH